MQATGDDISGDIENGSFTSADIIQSQSNNVIMRTPFGSAAKQSRLIDDGIINFNAEKGKDDADGVDPNILQIWNLIRLVVFVSALVILTCS